MIKDDERQLWNAVLEQWKRVKDLPEGEGQRIISAWQLGVRLHVPLKRIEYLAIKWHQQGKWIKLGTMTGTDVVDS